MSTRKKKAAEEPVVEAAAEVVEKKAAVEASGRAPLFQTPSHTDLNPAFR